MPRPASVPAITSVMLPSSRAPARAAMRAWAASGGPAASRSPIQNLPENATAVTFSRASASITGPIASMRVATSVSARADRSAAPGNANATTRHPCRRASLVMRAGKAPAPHIRPSVGMAGAPALRSARWLEPRHLGHTVPDHPLDLERHGQGAEIVLLRGDHRLPRPPPPHGAEQVLDLQLEGIVAVHLEMLDERRAAIADRAALHLVLLGGPTVDVDVLLG